MLAPKLRLGGGFTSGPQFHTGSSTEADMKTLKTAHKNLEEELEWTQGQLEKLKFQVSELQEELELGRQVELASSEDKSLTTVPISLLKLFGPFAFTAGISYDPFMCLPSLMESFPNMTQKQASAVSERASKVGSSRSGEDIL
ncbi:hypothetical protein CEUSTIGMA_g5259.t1 [Chlamydomonas eustigma]|uniref:Uncharacterized protein n=1 Tax=Chlamydomonas eustigma TaxID=1157962 RepID=A0A250X435_9CHLO|nr:hypothetical protein CEUSTIGMA_g5259.t1 [Chlamydomonas eustigma]|eukprot:GAX77816.1 hypothetical protein CEUSTIGMA_g5259.t1 [Chlamydomonas eustigma]